MSDTNELKQQRHELTTRLNALRIERGCAFRANSDAFVRRQIRTIEATLDQRRGLRQRILNLIGKRGAVEHTTRMRPSSTTATMSPIRSAAQ
jgi:hypothetical protein